MANPVKVTDDTKSIHDIGNFIMEYQPYQNAFLSALVNRIGRVIVTSRMWDNPWAVFKKGKLEYGETVEEIFANIAKPHSYDPEVAESEVFKREIPDVRAAFHTMNFQKFYKVTISNDQLRQAFLSYGELTDLIAKIVDTLYTGMNLDEFLVMKYMLCREALNGGIYTVDVSQMQGYTTQDNMVIGAFREYTNNLTFLKTIYNRARVRNATPISEQVIIIPNAIEAALGVEVLANAFNLNQVDYISKRIALDSFEFDADDLARLGEIFANDKSYTEFTDDEIVKLKKLLGVKLAKDWFMVFDNFEQFTENYNGQGLYWQYFYHTWKTFSVSPFANAVMFAAEGGEVTSVTVTPANAEVTFGSELQMTATVEGNGFFNKSVAWSIEGDSSSDTHIDPYTGVLYIGKHEVSMATIVVTATASDGQTGTARITVR